MVHIPIQEFLAGLAVGAALIGFWIAVRFPERGPESIQQAIFHVFASMAVGWGAASALDTMVGFGKTAAFAAVFIMLLPALVYTFLAAAWVMRIATQMLGRYRS